MSAPDAVRLISQRESNMHDPAVVAALDALFRAEYDNMVRLAFVLLRNQQDAEEVVQEAFLDVQRRWSALLNPGGYLRTAVVNGARRHLTRSATRRRILQTRVAPLQQEGESGEPLYLFDAIERLPPRARIAVVLAYYLRLSSTEIAEVIGCRPGTVKSLVHRGLKRLKKELEDG